jgi:hypothetical protein
MVAKVLFVPFITLLSRSYYALITQQCGLTNLLLFCFYLALVCTINNK